MPCLAIEIGISPDYENRLVVSAVKHDWDVQLVKRVPFSDEWLDQNHDPVPFEFLQRKDVWFHGDITSAQKACESTHWIVDGDWLMLSYYLLQTHCSKFCFNTNVQWTSMERFLEEPERFITGDHFVRPSAVTKVFSGQIVSKSTLVSDIRLMTSYEPPPKTLICIAPAKKIVTEARFVVIDDHIVTGSIYQINRQHVELALTPDSKIGLIAQSLLEQAQSNCYYPTGSYTFDICQGPDNEWSILETGALSCSGLYACNTDLIIQALARYYFGVTWNIVGP